MALNTKDKIIFDTRWFGQTGIGRFAQEMFSDDVFTPIQLKGNPAGILDVFKLTWYLLWNKAFYYSPGFNAPLFFLNRTAITIHDLNHIDIDSNTSKLKRLYYNIVLKRACKKSALIFTVSEFSKKRIVEWSNIDSNKVVVTYNGVSPAFHSNVKPYQPGYPYIFILGNRKKHKNEVLALQAFIKSNANKGVKLVFSGSPSENLNDIIVENHIEDKIVFLGKLPESDLASLYKGAQCLLFPSLYEGFGLPVIEAMACGCPVITSKTTSLGEVAGNSAILVNPKDINDIILAINSIFTQSNEQKYKLIQKGFKQCSKFTWNDSSAKLRNELISKYKEI